MLTYINMCKVRLARIGKKLDNQKQHIKNPSMEDDMNEKLSNSRDSWRICHSEKGR